MIKQVLLDVSHQVDAKAHALLLAKYKALSFDHAILNNKYHGLKREHTSLLETAATFNKHRSALHEQFSKQLKDQKEKNKVLKQKRVAWYLAYMKLLVSKHRRPSATHFNPIADELQKELDSQKAIVKDTVELLNEERYKWQEHYEKLQDSNQTLPVHDDPLSRHIKRNHQALRDQVDALAAFPPREHEPSS